MEIAKPTLDQIFEKEISFIVPAYQRHYVWDEKEQWLPLWEDILSKYNDRLNDKATYNHYIGSYVLVQKKKTTSQMVNKAIVIDGQQRLTTFQIIFIALREIFKENNISTNNIENYIFNSRKYDEKKDKLKLSPSSMNYKSFCEIAELSKREFDEKYITPQINTRGVGLYTAIERLKKKDRIIKAYLFFYNKIKELIPSMKKDENVIANNLENLLSAILLNFQFVEINLDDNDDPQMVFETLNGRGTPLAESDLIRNYIFMRANKNNENMDSLYDKYWCIFEKDFWDDSDSRGRNKNKNLDLFFIDYLILNKLKLISNKKIFFEYKDWVINKNSFQKIENELEDINQKAVVYENINIKKDVSNSILKELLDVCNKLGVSTFNPLFLFIETSNISETSKNDFYSILISYIVRRYLCKYDAKNYNKTCIEFMNYISEHNFNYREFKVYLKSRNTPTYIFPDNDKFKDAILHNNLFNKNPYENDCSQLTHYILRKIEENIRTSKQENIKIISSLTREHIMPQSWFEYWPLNGVYYTEQDTEEALKTWEPTEVQKSIVKRCSLINTLGNLTLLTQSLNSDKEVSNKGFDIKGPRIVAQSSLELNKYFQRPKWDEEEIMNRGVILFNYAKDVWTY